MSTRWIFIITVTFCFLTATGLYFLTEESTKWSYASDKKALCEKNGAQDCANLALDYRNGVTGLCTSYGGSRYGGSQQTKSCTLLDQDSELAMRYATIACNKGSSEGCFYQWYWTQKNATSLDESEELSTFCQQGVNLSCQILSTIAINNNNNTLLKKALEPACKSHEVLACLNVIKLDINDIIDKPLIEQMQFFQQFALSDRGISHLLTLCQLNYKGIYEARYACEAANKFQEGSSNMLKRSRANELKSTKERIANMKTPLTEIHTYLKTLPVYTANRRQR